jgi:AcrR family transcriptional regulator
LTTRKAARKTLRKARHTEQPRRADWAATRERILDSARTLFGERGYRATTVRDLADHSGLSQMSLHRHFPAKEELFEAAVLLPLGRFIEDYVSSRTERHSKRKDTAEDLHLFYDGLLKAILVEDRLFAAAALSLADDALLSKRMRNYVEPFFAKLDALMAEKVARNAVDLEPRITARAIVGMALGIAVYRGWLFPTDPPTSEVLAGELVKLTLWGIEGLRLARPNAKGSTTST